MATGKSRQVGDDAVHIVGRGYEDEPSDRPEPLGDVPDATGEIPVGHHLVTGEQGRRVTEAGEVAERTRVQCRRDAWKVDHLSSVFG
jgi:hypothetical protein